MISILVFQNVDIHKMTFLFICKLTNLPQLVEKVKKQTVEKPSDSGNPHDS